MSEMSSDNVQTANDDNGVSLIAIANCSSIIFLTI